MRVNVPIGSPGVLNKAASDVTLAGTVPALGRMGGYSLARLYESSVPDRLGRESTDANFLYYALWAAVALGDAGATALEIETLGHARRLFVHPRLAGPLPSGSGAWAFRRCGDGGRRRCGQVGQVPRSWARSTRRR